MLFKWGGGGGVFFRERIGQASIFEQGENSTVQNRGTRKLEFVKKKKYPYLFLY